ncbi:hypothetical protein PV10_00304 [Exophiala mesophila]|uniref:Uncharacterized protein n=1 Tax=Exophiala mesophila TaxID=212818 RepID=A0A0D1ZPA5_EXOME|nr:uncharacterized protein PV10_00304 [Exophiala mesophila]KIV96432.1 hypothetical protein PV10_00304 [Exophiala mesophila]
MHLTSSSITLLVLSALSSAGPIHKHPSQVRHVFEPQRRWVADGLGSTLDTPHKRREQSTRTLSSIDPFAVPTRQGTQDGKVGAVGVGGSNTSLLSLLTQSLTTTTATAAAVAVAATDESAPATGTNIQAPQDSGESTTTVRVQSTIFETVFVTAAESQPSTAAAPVAPVPATVTVVLVTTDGSTSFITLDGTSIPPTASDVVAAAAQTSISEDEDSAVSSTVTGSALPSETLTIRPGLGSIPASEARPVTLSAAAPPPPPPDAEIATASSPPTTAAPTVTASSSSSDADSLAVVPITQEPVQQTQNQNESLFTVTETVTTTVTSSP